MNWVTGIWSWRAVRGCSNCSIDYSRHYGRDVQRWIVHLGISDVFQRFLGHLEPLNQNPSDATLAALSIFAEFKMASRMAAIRMEIIEMTIFSLLFHPEMYFLCLFICFATQGIWRKRFQLISVMLNTRWWPIWLPRWLPWLHNNEIMKTAESLRNSSGPPRSMITYAWRELKLLHFSPLAAALLHTSSTPELPKPGGRNSPNGRNVRVLGVWLLDGWLMFNGAFSTKIGLSHIAPWQKVTQITQSKHGNRTNILKNRTR